MEEKTKGEKFKQILKFFEIFGKIKSKLFSLRETTVKYVKVHTLKFGQVIIIGEKYNKKINEIEEFRVAIFDLCAEINILSKNIASIFPKNYQKMEFEQIQKKLLLECEEVVSKAYKEIMEFRQKDRDEIRRKFSCIAESFDYKVDEKKIDEHVINPQLCVYVENLRKVSKWKVSKFIPDDCGEKKKDYLKNASKELSCKKEYVLKAVRKNPNSLEYALEEFRRDKDIVLTAMIVKGVVIEDVIKNFKDDKDFFLELVKHLPYSISFASPDLKNDKEFVKLIIKQNDYCKNYLPNNVLLEEKKMNTWNIEFKKKEKKGLRAWKKLKDFFGGKSTLKKDYYRGRKKKRDNESKKKAGWSRIVIEKREKVKEENVDLKDEKFLKAYENKVQKLEENKNKKETLIKSLKKYVSARKKREIKVFKIRTLLGNTFLDDFEPIRLLGSGQFGVVVEVLHKSTKANFCMKCMFNYYEFQTQAINERMLDVENVQHIPLHRHIIPIYRTFKDCFNDEFSRFFRKGKCFSNYSSDKTGFIVTPIYQQDFKVFCENVKSTTKKPPFFKTKEIINFIEKLLEGICFLFNFKIVHRFLFNLYLLFLEI